MTALNRVPDACDQGQLEGPYVHAEPGVEDLGALDALELVVQALVVVDLLSELVETRVLLLDGLLVLLVGGGQVQLGEQREKHLK